MEENTTPQETGSSKTMPIVLAVIAILVLGGVAYALTQRNNSTPATQTTNEQTPAESATGPTSVVESETEDAMEEKMENSDDSEGTVKEFTITGKNFEFSDEEIRVKQGDKVKIVFSSTGGFHSWVVDEFDGAATEQVNPGKTTTVEFTADKKGEYEYYCSVGNHRGMGMVGKLIVE